MYTLISVLLFVCGHPVSEVDTLPPISGDLPTVELISARPWRPSAGITTWDSTALARRSVPDVAELLRLESGAFVRSYGLGSLATATIRGASSSQVKILWNGLPIENPMLGLLDLSQLPTGFFDAVRLDGGGHSESVGSGAIGATLELDQEVETEVNTYGIGIDGGALGLVAGRGYGYFVSQNKKWHARSRVEILRSENDFCYFDPREERYRRQEHAALRREAVSQSLTYRPHANARLTLRVWAQRQEKDIPARAGQRVAASDQADAFVRTSLHYEDERTRVATGWFSESIDFRDERSGLRALTRFQKIPLEVERQWFAKGALVLRAGLSGQFTTAEAGAYGGWESQWQLSPFAHLTGDWDGWRWRASGRLEQVDGRVRAFSPAVILSRELGQGWSLAGRVGRDFRLPALNDRFWQPGGNPELRPESGWGQSLDLSYTPATSHSITLGAYHRLLRDWIQWAPNPESGFWQARNLTRVRSWGAQLRWRGKRRLGDWDFGYRAGVDYVRNQNQVEIQIPRLLAGEQLPHTPRWTAFGRLEISRGNWWLAYAQNLVGQRRDENRETLPAHWPARLTGGWRSGHFAAEIRVENAWDHDYRVFGNFRMPGRYLQGRVSYQWHDYHATKP